MVLAVNLNMSVVNFLERCIILLLYSLWVEIEIKSKYYNMFSLCDDSITDRRETCTNIGQLALFFHFLYLLLITGHIRLNIISNVDLSTSHHANVLTLCFVSTSPVGAWTAGASVAKQNHKSALTNRNTLLTSRPSPPLA